MLMLTTAISGDLVGTASGVLTGASQFPIISQFLGPIGFLFDGIFMTSVTNGIAQIFDVTGNIFAGLV